MPPHKHADTQTLSLHTDKHAKMGCQFWLTLNQYGNKKAALEVVVSLLTSSNSKILPFCDDWYYIGISLTTLSNWPACHPQQTDQLRVTRRQVLTVFTQVFTQSVYWKCVECWAQISPNICAVGPPRANSGETQRYTRIKSAAADKGASYRPYQVRAFLSLRIIGITKLGSYRT